jgi:hypothetical protein
MAHFPVIYNPNTTSQKFTLHMHTTILTEQCKFSLFRLCRVLPWKYKWTQILSTFEHKILLHFWWNYPSHVKVGPLSAHYGSSSGSKAFRYGEQLRIHWINRRGRQRRGAPSVWEFSESQRLFTAKKSESVCYEMLRIGSIDEIFWTR